VYYDECSIANGWYLTGWCPQFESGSVLVTANGRSMILGGPESEPFARQDSAVKDTRNLPVFMVPDEEYPNAQITDFGRLFAEISQSGAAKRVGIVGMDKIPTGVYRQLLENFKGVEIVDITQAFLEQRYIKSDWEREQMSAGFAIGDKCYAAMKAAVRPGAFEYEVAAAGETAARSRGASGYGFKTIVGSGPRSNAVVPTALDRKMQSGELVMIGMAPQVKGYCGCIGDTLPVSGAYSPAQAEMMKRMREVFVATKQMLRPGVAGKEVHAPGKRLFEKYGYMKYLVCPFAHTIGINEAESPFFGPNSEDIIKPDMTICVDVSFFGHPEFNGVRIETGYYITESGPVPFSSSLDGYLANL
jgi:Xaa-Pro aminopeptidase